MNENKYKGRGHFIKALDNFQKNQKSDIDIKVFKFVESECKKLNITHPSRNDIEKILGNYKSDIFPNSVQSDNFEELLKEYDEL